MTAEEIKKAINKNLGIDIGNTTSMREYTEGRAVYYQLTKEHCPYLTLMKIGEVVNIMSHSNVRYGIDVVFDKVKMFNKPLYELYLRLSPKAQTDLAIRSAQIELLDGYSMWLSKHGYMDTDWWAEEPLAIDEFLKTLK